MTNVDQSFKNYIFNKSLILGAHFENNIFEQVEAFCINSVKSVKTRILGPGNLHSDEFGHIFVVCGKYKESNLRLPSIYEY